MRIRISENIFFVLFVFFFLVLFPKQNVSNNEIERLKEGLRIKTICWSPSNYNVTAFLELHKHLEKSFPLIHSSKKIKKIVINNYTLMYKVEGKNPDLKPYMLMAHQDVVPVDGQEWLLDPFGGKEKNGFIYGRGILDNKHNLYSIMESIESLLKEKHEFKRGFYFVSGHDEECLGNDGAREVKRWMEREGVKLEYVLDEGTVISKDIFPGISNLLALIGVSEKGIVTLKLSVSNDGGHSSLPSNPSSIGILAAAITKLESNPHPSFLGKGVEVETFKTLSKYASFPYNILYFFIRFFPNFFSGYFSKNPSSNALIRTTTAVTMFNAGIKTNVIPYEAVAYVNHRVHPFQNIQEVIDYDKKIINNDQVKITVIESAEPTQASCFHDNCGGYRLLKKALQSLWPEAVPIPALLFAMTDSRYFFNLTDNIYRFSPIFLSKEDFKMIHGVNEKLSQEAYFKMISFFRLIFLNSDQENFQKETEPITQFQDL